MKLIQVFFSPIGFAIGFLAPLVAQGLLYFDIAENWKIAYSVGILVALFFGLMAQTRGSWIWLKS
jgi:hypothetical protein